MQPAIRTQALSKIYRAGFWRRPSAGVQQLDLQVEPGEIFGFIGPNGAGKTTTIKMLVGLHRPSAGQGWLFGVPVSDPKSRLRLGFLPERPYFPEHLSARELLDFHGHLLRLTGASRKARIDQLLARVDLARVGDRPLRKFSKGMLQRVGLCQALLGQPDLVILDEPMSGLDPIGRALVRDLILEEAHAGRTIFYSSHILPDVEAISDRVAILANGHLRGVGTVSELLGDRVRHIDLTVRGASGVPLPGRLLRDEQDLRVTRLAPEQVTPALRAVLDAGGDIVELNPRRRSLEDALLAMVEDA